MDNLIKPPIQLLIKLGSIAVHADELHSPGGHEYDLIAMQNLLRDPVVVEWIEGMTKAAFLPLKRSAPARVVTLAEGQVSKGGRNPPNTSSKRPPAPKGSGGRQYPKHAEPRSPK